MNNTFTMIAACAALLPMPAVAQTAAAAPVRSPSTSSGQALSKGSEQAYPNKPIRVVLPVPAGGTPDVLARTVTPAMAGLLGQQARRSYELRLNIDNRFRQMIQRCSRPDAAHCQKVTHNNSFQINY
jgi:hypothetical protein